MSTLPELEKSEISPRALRVALKRNIIAGGCGVFFGVCLWPQFLTEFVRLLGANAWHVGLITSLPLLAFPCQLFSAMLVERLHRRKRYWFITASIHRCLWFLIAGLAFWTGRSLGGWELTAFFILYFLSHVMSSLSVPPWFSWMADLIPKDEAGKFWSRRAMWHQLVAVSGVLIGRVVDVFPADSLWPYGLLFTLAAVVGQADLVIHNKIPEPRAQLPDAPPTLRDLASPLADKNFRRLLIHLCIFNFGMNFGNAFINLYFLEYFHFTQFQIAMFMAVMLVTRMLMARFWGFLCDRFGSQPVLSICDFAVALFPFAMAAAPLMGGSAFIYLLGVHIFFGLFNIGVEISANNLMLNLSPRKNKSLFVAAFFSCTGLVGALGPLVGGGFLEGLRLQPSTSFVGMSLNSFQWLFLIAGIIRLLNAPFSLRIRERPGHSAGQLVRRLLESNPFRVVHHSYVLTDDTNEERRVESILALGASASSIGLRELMHALHDPSLTVRRESARALGQIGDAEAVEALVSALKTPELMIGDEAARALGIISHPSAIPALAAALYDPQICREAAIALGQMGNLEAAPALSQFLESGSADPMTRVLAAEALSRIGAADALPHIIPLLAATRQPVLRRQLAVAVASFFGRSEGFYELMNREFKVRGLVLAATVSRATSDARLHSKSFLPWLELGMEHYERMEWGEAGVRFLIAALQARGLALDLKPGKSQGELVASAIHSLAELGEGTWKKSDQRQFYWLAGSLLAGQFSKRHTFQQEDALLSFFLWDISRVDQES